jgi:hypothetical protein
MIYQYRHQHDEGQCWYVEIPEGIHWVPTAVAMLGGFVGIHEKAAYTTVPHSQPQGNAKLH